jgi:hypothetical protein
MKRERGEKCVSRLDLETDKEGERRIMCLRPGARNR